MNGLSARTVVPSVPGTDVLLHISPTADGGMLYCTGDGRMLTQEGRVLAQLVPPPSQQLVTASVSPNGRNVVFFEHVAGTLDTIMHVFVGPRYFRLASGVETSDSGTIYMTNCSICDDGAIFCAVDFGTEVLAVAPAVGSRTESVTCTMELIPDDEDDSPYHIVNFDLAQVGPNCYRYAAVADSGGTVHHDPLEDGSMRVIHGEISLPTASGLQPQFTVTDLPSPFGTPWPGEAFEIDEPDTTRVAVSPTTLVLSNHHFGGNEGHVSVWDVATNQLMWRLSPPEDSDLSFAEGVLLLRNNLVAVIGTDSELSVYSRNGDLYGSVTLDVDGGIDTYEVGMPTAGSHALVVNRRFAALLDITEPLRRKMLAMIAASRRKSRTVPRGVPYIPPELWLIVFDQLRDLI